MIFLCAIFVITTLPADNGLLTFRGKNGYPFFNGKGQLDILIGDRVTPNSAGAVNLPSRRILSPHIKKDNHGSVWMIWQENEGAGRQVFFGRLLAGKITQRRSLSQGQAGAHYAPALAIAADDQPWVVWITQMQTKHRLKIQNLNTDQLWTLDPGTKIYSPCIVIDGYSHPWVFWVGSQDGVDKIFYSCCRGNNWIKPAILAPEPNTPQFHPAAAVEKNGNPWICWSGYDGNDYEIFTSRWNGSGWQTPIRISDNQLSADAQPAAALYLNSIPMVAWTRSHQGKRDVLLSYRENNNWRSGINISLNGQRNKSPVLITEGEKIALLWQSQNLILVKSISFFQLQTAPPPRKKEQMEVQSLHLGRNKFIGFGDSITFGSQNGPSMAVGYIPRLEVLLQKSFEAPFISNRGIPGEPTWEGLSRIDYVLSVDMALYLLLMEGTNDVSITDYSLDTTAFNLEQIILKASAYGVFPLLSTVIPRARARWTASARLRTQELNEKIEQLSQDRDVTLVDNYNEFYNFPESKGGYEALLSPDNLHPSNKGYEVMSETWYDHIRKIPFPPENITALKKHHLQAVELTWEQNQKIIPASKLKIYRIYRKRFGDKNFAQVGAVIKNVYNFTDFNVDLNQEYYYVISAVNEDDVEGPISETVVPVIGDPYAPINISTEILVNRAFLYQEYITVTTWSANTFNQGNFNITAYRIYRKEQGQADDMFELLREVDASQLEYRERNISSREQAEGYIYGVSSVDVDNNESIIGKG